MMYCFNIGHLSAAHLNCQDYGSWVFVVHNLHWCLSICSTCLCVLAAPILRAEELVQENKTILNRVQPTSGTGEPSRDVETFTNVDKGPRPCSGPNMFNNRGANRGRGCRGGRGRRHQDTPQPRRRTLLEMVKMLLRLYRMQIRIGKKYQYIFIRVGHCWNLNNSDSSFRFRFFFEAG